MPEAAPPPESGDTAPPVPPWLPAGLRAAEQIGRGAHGEVWRAWQPQFERWIALKVLGEALSGRAEEAFRRECRAIGSLSGHPFVVPVYDAGALRDGRPYLVMPFLSQGSLADALQRRGPLGVAETLDVGVKVASALAAAHGAGVLHRDVKPENLLLSHYGEPQLADFGIARGLDERTRTGLVAATPLHAAPEVLEGRPASAASDVYGLGSTLFRLLAGRAAFFEADDASLFPLLLRISSEPPPDLAVLGLGVPAPVADLVSATMAKDPAQRPPGGAALGRALQDVQAQLGWRVTVAPGLAVAPAPRAPATPSRLGDVRAPGAAPARVITAAPPTPVAPVGASARVAPSAAPSGPAPAPAAAAPARARRRRLPAVLTALTALVVGTGVVGGVLLVWNHTQGTPPQAAPAATGVPATPTAGPSAPSPASSAARPPVAGPSPPTRLPDGRVRVRVLDSGMGNPAVSHAGPSTDTTVYANGAQVAIGDSVTLMCAVYGEHVRTARQESSVWSFGDRGWLTDARLDTRQDEPLVPACAGSVERPVAGSGAPRPDVGPFPLLADAPVQVHEKTRRDSAAIAVLPDGTFVTLSCVRTGQHVDPLPRFPGAKGSSDWDLLVGGGWVPDVYVNSASIGATAKRCP